MISTAMLAVLHLLLSEKVGYLGLHRYPARSVYTLKRRGLVALEGVHGRSGGFHTRVTLTEQGQKLAGYLA